MREWHNYGDVGFLSEGGSMVRKAWDDEEIRMFPLLGEEYEVLMLAPLTENEVLTGIKLINIADYVNDDTIERFAGEMPGDPMLLAASWAEYYGFEPGIDTAPKQSGMYSQRIDFIVSKADAERWLYEIGVPKEYIK